MVSGQWKQWERRGLPVFIEDEGADPEWVNAPDYSIHPFIHQCAPAILTIFNSDLLHFSHFSLSRWTQYVYACVHTPSLTICPSVFHTSKIKIIHCRQVELGITHPECVGQTRTLSCLIKRQIGRGWAWGGHPWSRQGRKRERPLSLSFPVSVPTAYFSSFTIPDRPAKQPSRPCCSVPLTHEQQQYNNRKGPPLLSLAGPVSNLPGGGSCYYR